MDYFGNNLASVMKKSYSKDIPIFQLPLISKANTGDLICRSLKSFWLQQTSLTA